MGGCEHGAHVAGIAAAGGSAFSGVAKDASSIAVQVFSLIQDASGVGIGAWESDLMSALEFVYRERTATKIASVNMSLGVGASTGYGDNDPLKAPIDNLRAAGIASGNSGFTNALSYPACISSAVSVGATTKGDVVASFSNSASFLSLLAPGPC